jgi:hypothetical protein
MKDPMEVVKAAAHAVRLLELAHAQGYGEARDAYTKEAELLLRRALMPSFGHEVVQACWTEDKLKELPKREPDVAGIVQAIVGDGADD